jgi:UDP-N-acetylglucosamine acyltransferase
MNISELAVVSKKAKIGDGCQIGPFAIIEDDVELAPGVKIGSHAHVLNGTTIGEGTCVHMGAVIGNIPQDLAFEDKPTFVKIGRRCVVREYATIHRGTKEGTITTIGDDCYLMAVSHVGHNCQIGNKVIIANGALLAGYVTVEDMAFISGNVVIHQYCRIGKLAMLGGFTGINKDVPPFMLVRGPSIVRTLNVVGLRRAKISHSTLAGLKEAFRLMYLTDLNIRNALEEIKKLPRSPELDHLIQFIESSKRGICMPKLSDEEYFG